MEYLRLLWHWRPTTAWNHSIYLVWLIRFPIVWRSSSGWVWQTTSLATMEHMLLLMRWRPTKLWQHWIYMVELIFDSLLEALTMLMNNVGCNIGVDGAKAIALALKTNKMLTWLRINSEFAFSPLFCTCLTHYCWFRRSSQIEILCRQLCWICWSTCTCWSIRMSPKDY